MREGVFWCGGARLLSTLGHTREASDDVHGAAQCEYNHIREVIDGADLVAYQAANGG